MRSGASPAAGHTARRIAAAALLAFAHVAQAADVSVVGLFPNKAVLVIDGGPPKTYSVGNSVADGVRLVAVSGSDATFEINSKRRIIAIGEHVNRSAPAANPSVTLQADGRGHYLVQGWINGGTVRMLLDTGATMIALPAAEAARLGINYKSGAIAYMNTANGVVPAYRITLNTVRVGDIELNQVEAVVQEHGLATTLLGMSFLSRTAMQRDGEQMIPTKRY
jgi:aspartyl protease family protein